MFDLSKWYGDCVSPRGNVLIAYTARLHWGALSLDYGSVLEKHGTTVSCRQTAPDEWKWDGHETELRERIFESADGVIDWHCVHPRASVDAGTVRGSGYREHLHMTIAPWHLPIRELRWGRYLSPSHTLIWIDWLGDYNTTVVYRDGSRVATTSIDDHEIVFADGSRLQLDCGFVLRDGALGTTVLSAIPVLSRTAPARMLAVTECKWLSHARYEGDESWAIHEVVRWP